MVAKVSVAVLAFVPSGVTLVGEIVHVAEEGPPLQASDVAWLKPFVGVNVIIAVVELPCVTLAEVGLIVSVKSGTGAVVTT